QLHDHPETALCRPIVARSVAGQAKVVVRRRRERKVPNPCSAGNGALPEGTRFGRVARHPEMLAHVDRYPPEPGRIIQRHRENFGAAEMPEKPYQLCEWVKRVSEVEAKINRLSNPFASLR